MRQAQTVARNPLAEGARCHRGTLEHLRIPVRPRPRWAPGRGPQPRDQRQFQAWAERATAAREAGTDAARDPPETA
eukprot:2196807-Pyramimonas_sp.AAC.1